MDQLDWNILWFICGCWLLTSVVCGTLGVILLVFLLKFENSFVAHYFATVLICIKLLALVALSVCVEVSEFSLLLKHNF